MLKKKLGFKFFQYKKTSKEKKRKGACVWRLATPTLCDF